jgi:hypothetical protein
VHAGQFLPPEESAMTGTGVGGHSSVASTWQQQQLRLGPAAAAIMRGRSLGGLPRTAAISAAAIAVGMQAAGGGLVISNSNSSGGGSAFSALTPGGASASGADAGELQQVAAARGAQRQRLQQRGVNSAGRRRKIEARSSKASTE